MNQSSHGDNTSSLHFTIQSRRKTLLFAARRGILNLDHSHTEVRRALHIEHHWCARHRRAGRRFHPVWLGRAHFDGAEAVTDSFPDRDGWRKSAVKVGKTQDKQASADTANSGHYRGNAVQTAR
jgi:hypothetical protein